MIRERNNDKKETNIEDFLGKFSKTSKEVKCWFSVELPIEKSNIAGTETKRQFCGQKSKLVDPASIHPSPTHLLPYYEDPGNLLRSIDILAGAPRSVVQGTKESL